MAGKAGRFSRGDDLTGLWSGEYWYDAPGQQPAAFSAWLDETGGSVSGTTLEIAMGEELAAMIEGARMGTDVAFAKRYDPPKGVYNAIVLYAGSVNEELTRIDGQWRIGRARDSMSGSFFMERITRGAQAESREADARVSQKV